MLVAKVDTSRSQEWVGFPWISMDFPRVSPESQGRFLGIRWAALLGGGLDSNERRVLRPLPQIHPRGPMGDPWGTHGGPMGDQGTRKR